MPQIGHGQHSPFLFLEKVQYKKGILAMCADDHLLQKLGAEPEEVFGNNEPFLDRLLYGLCLHLGLCSLPFPQKPTRAVHLRAAGNQIFKSPIPSLGIKAAGAHPYLSDLRSVP